MNYLQCFLLCSLLFLFFIGIYVIFNEDLLSIFKDELKPQNGDENLSEPETSSEDEA